MYEILAWKYGLEEVSEQDSLDLIRLCQREEDNKTADDLLSRLHWPNGLAKLVTFGVGMKLDGAHSRHGAIPLTTRRTERFSREAQ